MTTTTAQQAPIGSDVADYDELAAWQAVVRSLYRVDPYLDPEEIDRFAPIQDEADWDLTNFSQLMDAVALETGITVAEEDYPLVASLAWLERNLSSGMDRRQAS